LEYALRKTLLQPDQDIYRRVHRHGDDRRPRGGGRCGSAQGHTGGGAAGHTGYAPRSAELLDSSIGQNIARFIPGAPPEAILKAARTAGIHEMVLRLPEVCETPMAPAVRRLAAG